MVHTSPAYLTCKFSKKRFIIKQVTYLGSWRQYSHHKHLRKSLQWLELWGQSATGDAAHTSKSDDAWAEEVETGFSLRLSWTRQGQKGWEGTTFRWSEIPPQRECLPRPPGGALPPLFKVGCVDCPPSRAGWWSGGWNEIRKWIKHCTPRGH